MQKLREHTIYGALTRPAMLAGVTIEYHLFNIMISMTAFIGLSPLYGLIYLPLHAFGWAVSHYDPHFFMLCAKKLSLPQHPNSKLWGVKAYAPF